MKEIWLPVTVPGFEKHYSVSNWGRVRSEVTRRGSIAGTIKSCLPGPAGYCFIGLSVGGVEYRLGLHQLVAMAFIPNPEAKRCVNHRDSNRSNNWAINLQWTTHKENSEHAVRGPHWAAKRLRGSNHYKAKVTEEVVIAIRAQAASGELLKDIAAKVGLNASTVSSIVARRYWKHI